MKANLAPVDYLRTLVCAGQPNFLISAYDLALGTENERNAMRELLQQAVGAGQTVLMDSGNYEAYWKADKSWRENDFHEVCRSVPYHLCFCFDNQSPPVSVEAIIADVVERVSRNQESATGTVIPIVHGQTHLLPDAVAGVANRLYPSLIAVPERELGQGVLARARTVRKIRHALDRLGVYTPLHLLGTGNPVSLLVYALAGADSFDGLEWSQTVVDHTTGRLHHMQHWDFFADQTAVGQRQEIPFIPAALLHNLVFFRDFISELDDALASGNGEAFAGKWLSAKEYDIVMRNLEGAEK